MPPLPRFERIAKRKRVPGPASDAKPPAQAEPVTDANDPLLTHASEEDRRIVKQAWPYSMTGAARLLALIDSVRYCTCAGIGGAFVECGVWRGGSVLAMILTLQELGVSDRDIYLYDTFEGMTEPTELDTSDMDGDAIDEWRQAQHQGRRAWGEVFGEQVFNEPGVRTLLTQTGYPQDRLHFVKGRVEDTVPEVAPEEIALLRLDTDWYESTKHEFIHLYPRLQARGVLIIDDYGHWKGARRAADEYLSACSPLLMTRVDYTCRIAVKSE